MYQTPCEEYRWTVLPFIRKELACSITKKHGICQKDAAKLLGLTPAALSQYKCNKRGHYCSKESVLIEEIDDSAEKILDKGNEIVVSEICRICKFISSNDISITLDK